MRRTKVGFTLVELLVVIAIIGILVGLLLPAVQAARNAARKLECSNKVKQIALATLQFELDKKRYPGVQEVFGKTTAGNYKVGSWAVAILPYLEQQPLRDNWDDPTTTALWTGTRSSTDANASQFYPIIAGFVCGNDTVSTSANIESEFATNSYVVNAGFYPVPDFSVLDGFFGYSSSKTPHENAVNSQIAANGVFGIVGPTTIRMGASTTNTPIIGAISGIKSDAVRDGKSQTLAISENLQAADWGYWGTTDVSNSPRVATGMMYLYRATTTAVPAGRPVPNPVVPKNLINGEFLTSVLESDGSTSRPSSQHTGSVNAAMLDGSVRSISNEVEYFAYQAMLTPNGRASHVPNNTYTLKDEDAGN